MRNGGVGSDSEWNRIMELFDRLVEGGDPETICAAEHDVHVRQSALKLLLHHRASAAEKFLDRPIDVELLPVFSTGQILLDRFEVERALGQGGMGEVYLAYDRTLGERVALKTIARCLAASESLKRRFIAEVQSARRVTHPNVCRIHEVFQDREIPFFAMEYVAGSLLSDLLKAGPLDAAIAKGLVIQMAEGLHAAHENGVIHGDFKPGNIMIVSEERPRPKIMDFGLARVFGAAALNRPEDENLPGGTRDYMAPELLAGATSSVASDIYAFGKVARLVMPGQRMWDDCTKDDVAARPTSLKLVIDRLRADVTRRYWIGGALLSTAGALYYAARSSGPRTISLPTGARILLNGFRSAANEIANARLTRSLLMTALTQSARIRTIVDLDLLPTLRHIEPEGNLPVEGPLLRRLLEQLRAAFWIEADLSEKESRHSLELRLLRTASNEVVTQASFRDLPNIILLAQQAAVWLRRMTGESERSLATNPVSVISQTSQVPEALEKYYDAMDHYALAEMAQVVPLLEEALRLDPSFPQAHSVLGMAMNALGRYEDAFREVDQGMRLANRLPERERAWIETNYYTLEEDPVQMVELARRNLAYFPDEPRFCRVLAHTLCRSGDAPASIAYSRKAVDLSPAGMLQRADLVYNLCEAGQFAEGLAEFQAALSDPRLADSQKGPADARGNLYNNWIYEPGGLAYLGLQRYQEAMTAFHNVPGERERVIEEQGVNIMEGRFDESIGALEEYRAGAKVTNDIFQANEFLCGLGTITSRFDLARNSLELMVKLPPFPPMAKKLDCVLFWAFRLADDKALSSAHSSLSEIAARWPNTFTRAASLHAKALLAWRRKSLDEAERLLLESCGAAFSIWALFDLADFYTHSKPTFAERYWSRLEEHRGTLLERWFPGSLILAWLGRADAANSSGDRNTAFKYSQKVLDHWSAANPGLHAVRVARSINTATKSSIG
jgi:serine/threonine protein kinase/Tfp pilus assembly protein PilF